MKAQQHIDVWIAPDGAITIDAVGYTGNSCEEATRFLEDELGTVGRKQRSRDWYRRSTNHNKTTNQQKQQS